MAEWLIRISKATMLIALIFGFALPGSANEVAAGESLFSNLIWMFSGLTATAALAVGSPMHSARAIWNVKPLRWFLILLGLCFAWMIAGSWYMGNASNLRHAVNASWQVFTSGLIVGIMLLLNPSTELASNRWRNQILLLLLAIGVCLAVHGLYQKLVEIPRDIARYNANPVEVLKEAGLQAEPNSAIDLLYRGRLLDAAPTATYSLTNSFAITLAACLILVASLILNHLHRTPRLALILFTLVAVPILICLLWTKSRTAWLAVIVGLAAISLTNMDLMRRIHLHARAAWAGVLSIGLIGTGAVWIWDKSIFLDAMKSLLYRSSYWWTVLEMVKRYPVFGVGAGNFQDYYSQYRPPLSAETVSDPHSLWFETLANGGIVAAVLLVLAFIWMFYHLIVLRSKIESSHNLSESHPTHRNIHSGASIGSNASLHSELPQTVDWSFVIGVILGVLTPWAAISLTGIFPDPTTYLFSVPITAVLIYACIKHFKDAVIFQSSTCWVVLLTTVICLSLAGGWMTPGISNWFFVIVGLAVSQWFPTAESQSEQALKANPIRWPFIAMLFSLVIFLWSAWLPTRRSEIAIEMLSDERKLPSSELLEQFVQSDRWNPDLLRQAAAIEQIRCLNVLSRSAMRLGPEAELYQSFQKYSHSMVQHNKQSWQAWTQRGNWRFELAMLDDAWLPDAVDDYRQAVSLYPGDVEVLLQAAVACFLNNEFEKAAQLLAQAEEIDRETVHLEKRISTGVVFVPASLERFLRQKRQSPPTKELAELPLYEELLKSGRELAGSDPSRWKAEPLARTLRKILDKNSRESAVNPAS